MGDPSRSRRVRPAFEAESLEIVLGFGERAGLPGEPLPERQFAPWRNQAFQKSHVKLELAGNLTAGPFGAWRRSGGRRVPRKARRRFAAT